MITEDLLEDMITSPEQYLTLDEEKKYEGVMIAIPKTMSYDRYVKFSALIILIMLSGYKIEITTF